MNVTCPYCKNENAYFDFINEKGSHYVCPDCDHTWVDTNIKLEEEDKEPSKLLSSEELAKEIINEVFIKGKRI